MEAVELKATLRTNTGKGPARQTRLRGQVPAVLYGPETESLSLDVEAREVAKLLRRSTGVNTLVNLNVDGREPRKVLIREYQIHPVKRTLVHVDFYINRAVARAISWRSEKMCIFIAEHLCQRVCGLVPS